MAEREVPCYPPGSFDKWWIQPSFRNMEFIGDLHSFLYKQNSKLLITDRLIVTYDLQPKIFGRLMHLRKLRK